MSTSASSGKAVQPKQRRRPDSWLVGALALQAALSLLVIWTHFYFQAHRLAAGWWFLESGRADISLVNPAPIQALMALPMWLLERDFTLAHVYSDKGRVEYLVGTSLFQQCGERAELYQRLGATVLVPLLLLGTIGCYRCAAELAGVRAARLASWFYALSPSILGWGPTLFTDVCAASIWIWLGRATVHCWQSPTRANAVRAGLWLAAANAVKLSGVLWLIAYAVLAAGLTVAGLLRTGKQRGHLRRGAAFALALGVAVVAINVAWGFDRTGFRLGELRAKSELLLGRPNPRGILQTNRFADTILAALPVPLPMPYVQGLDLQQWDMEHGLSTRLYGRDYRASPWYFLPAALALKLTPAELLLVVLFLGAIAAAWVGRGPAVPQRWLLCLLIVPPLILSLLIMKGKVGLFRYWLAGWPFLVVGGAVVVSRLRKARWVVAAVVAAQLGSALSSFAHWHAYVNLFAFGRPPAAYLAVGNLASNALADYPYLARWLEALPSHPTVRMTSMMPALVGLRAQWEPKGSTPAGAVWLVHSADEWSRQQSKQPQRTVAVIGGTLYVVEERE